MNLKKLTILTLAIVSFNSCRENIEVKKESEIIPRLSLNEIEYSQLSEDIQQRFTKSTEFFNGLNSGRFEAIYGIEGTDKLLVYRDTIGYESYTLSLKNYSDTLKFSYLSVHNSEGYEEEVLVEYFPDISWYFEKEDKKDFSDFHGYIKTSYSNSVENLQYYKKGKIKNEQTSSNSGRIEECYLVNQTSYYTFDGDVDVHTADLGGYAVLGDVEYLNIVFYFACAADSEYQIAGLGSGHLLIDYNPNYYGSVGSGGGAFLGSTDPNSQIEVNLIEEYAEYAMSEFFITTELNTSEKTAFQDAFKDFLSVKENRDIFMVVKNRGKIKIQIDASINSVGNYNPNTKIIKFRSREDMNFHSVTEEVFHAYQDYKIGTGKYVNSNDKKGMSNIEFEAKLYHDIIISREVLIKQTLDIPIFYLGNNSLEYLEWVKLVSRDYSSFDWSLASTEYFNFMEDFIDFNQEYNFPIDYTLNPTTLIDLLGN